jgi:hypothetical protein
MDITSAYTHVPMRNTGCVSQNACGASALRERLLFSSFSRSELSTCKPAPHTATASAPSLQSQPVDRRYRSSNQHQSDAMQRDGVGASDHSVRNTQHGNRWPPEDRGTLPGRRRRHTQAR